jgi:hypothetical protein
VAEALVGVVDNAVDVGAKVVRIVDAEMNLADADVEYDQFAGDVAIEGQRVRVAGPGDGTGLRGHNVD